MGSMGLKPVDYKGEDFNELYKIGGSLEIDMANKSKARVPAKPKENQRPATNLETWRQQRLAKQESSGVSTSKR